MAGRTLCWQHCLVVMCGSLHIWNGQWTRAEETVAKKYFTYEQRAGLVETEQLNELVAPLVKAEKYSECLAIAEHCLTVQRAVGDDEREIAVTLGFMAELRKRTKDFAGALRDREAILRIETNLSGADHWKTTNARREVDRARRLVRYSPEEHAKLKQAESLRSQAEKALRSKKVDVGLSPAQQLVDISRKLYGTDDSDFADSLVLLARVQHAMRNFDDAEKSLNTVLDVQRRQLGERHPDIATTLIRLAAIHDERGSPTKSLPLYQLAIEIHRASGEKNSSLADSLNRLAFAYRSTGEFAKAEPLFLESLDVYRTLYGERNASYAEVLRNLGSTYTQAGNYSRAHETLQRALTLRKELSGDRDPAYAVILSDLALLANRMGEHDRAIELYTQAAAIDKQQSGEKSYRYALRIGNLAATYADAGEFEKAEPLYREDMEITKGIYGEAHPKHAANLNHLALLYLRMGDHLRAEPLLKQALTIRESTLGEQHRDVTDNLIDLAHARSAAGDHASSLSLLKRALSTRRTILGDRHEDVAVVLHNLGSEYVLLGQFEPAKASFTEGIETMRAAVGESHPGNVMLLASLGQVHITLGEYDQARPLLVAGLEIAQRSFGARSEDRLQIQRLLAKLYQCTQEYEKAKPLLLAAIDAARDQLELASTLQSERQQLGMRRVSWQYLNAYLDLTGRTSESADEAYAHVLRWKGEVGARQQQLRRMRRLAASGNPTAVQLQSELATATRDMARLSRSSSLQGAEEAPTIAKLRDRIEDLQTKLAAVSTDVQRELGQQKRTPADICAALPTGAVLVDLIVVDAFIPNEQPGRPSRDEGRLIAFVVRHDHGIERVDLGPVDPIRQMILEWRKRFGVSSADANFGERLRAVLWEPLAKHVRNAKVLLISPHAATAPLPWGALPGKAPGKYLIEELDIAVVPIPTLLPDLLAGDAARGKQSNAAPSLLLVGDVDFDAPPQTGIAANSPQPTAIAVTSPGRLATRGADRLAWKALPGTRDEIAAIKKSYGQRFGGATPGELTQRAATKNAICEAAAKHQFLHFSTHGFFAPAMIKSAAEPSTSERGDLGNQSTTINLAEHHPGLLSGLVLAGANRLPAAGEEDGILTALEVGELDLGNVELATLSACETGLGETAGGEGLLGLQRAFQTAGAKTVVSGLWQVPDKATQVLMTRFYDNLWQKKMSRLGALIAAQRSMLNLPLSDREALRGLNLDPDDLPTAPSDRLPPFYWAAFVLSGDWR